jgi:hypothetical protein
MGCGRKPIHHIYVPFSPQEGDQEFLTSQYF